MVLGQSGNDDIPNWEFLSAHDSPKCFLYPASMDQQDSRRLVESQRLLTEGRARIERQRAIIARLKQLGVDSAKQTALLNRMLEAQDQEAQRAAEFLDRLKATLGPIRAEGNTPMDTNLDTNTKKRPDR